MSQLHQRPILEAFNFPVPPPRPTKKVFFCLQLMFAFFSFIFTGIALAFYSLSIYSTFLKKRQRYGVYSWEAAIFIFIADIFGRTLIGCTLRRHRYGWIHDGTWFVQTTIIHFSAFIFTFLDFDICKLFEGDNEDTLEMSVIISILFACVIGGFDAFFYVLVKSMLRMLFRRFEENICFRFKIMQCFSVAGALSFAYDGGTIAQIAIIILAAFVALGRVIVVTSGNPLLD